MVRILFYFLVIVYGSEGLKKIQFFVVDYRNLFFFKEVNYIENVVV